MLKKKKRQELYIIHLKGILSGGSSDVPVVNVPSLRADSLLRMRKANYHWGEQNLHPLQLSSAENPRRQGWNFILMTPNVANDMWGQT